MLNTQLDFLSHNAPLSPFCFCVFVFSYQSESCRGSDITTIMWKPRGRQQSCQCFGDELKDFFTLSGRRRSFSLKSDEILLKPSRSTANRLKVKTKNWSASFLKSWQFADERLYMNFITVEPFVAQRHLSSWYQALTSALRSEELQRCCESPKIKVRPPNIKDQLIKIK